MSVDFVQNIAYQQSGFCATEPRLTAVKPAIRTAAASLRWHRCAERPRRDFEVQQLPLATQAAGGNPATGLIRLGEAAPRSRRSTVCRHSRRRQVQ